TPLREPQAQLVQPSILHRLRELQRELISRCFRIDHLHHASLHLNDQVPVVYAAYRMGSRGPNKTADFSECCVTHGPGLARIAAELVTTGGTDTVRDRAAVSPELRSGRWFGTRDVAGLMHRSYLKAEGISQAAIEGRPVVG